MNLKRYKELCRLAFGIDLRDETIEEAQATIHQSAQVTPERYVPATVVPTTINDEKRTVDVIVATETPVLRYDFENEFYMEVLDMAGCHLELVKDGQIPLLMAHDSHGDINAQLGSTNNLRVEEGKLVGTRHFSITADKAWTMTKEGHLNRQSVGYLVHDYVDIQAGKKLEVNGRVWEAEEDLPLRVVTSWEPIEDSIVHVPADRNAGLREQTIPRNPAGAKQNPKAREGKEHKMNKTLKAFAIRRYALAADATDEAVAAEMAKRSETEDTLIMEMQREAVETAQKREAEIRDYCKKEGYDNLADDMVAEGDIETVKKRIAWLKKAAERTEGKVPPAGKVSVTREESEKVRAAMTDGLCVRANVAWKDRPVDGAYDFANMRVSDMCRELLIRKGENPGYDVESNFKRAIATTDLPIILNSTVKRSLMQGFDEASETYEQFCAMDGSVPDFRPQTVARLLAKVKLEEVAEGDEYPYANASEDSASVSVKKHGVSVAYTWESAQNDDLNQLAEIPREFGNAVRDAEASAAFAFLISNPTMRDSVALFHSTHANLAASGAAPSEATLSAALRAMSLQTDGPVENPRRLRIRGEHIIAPVSLEGVVRKLLFSQVWNDSNAAATQVNTVFQKVTPVFDPRLDEAFPISGAQPWFITGPKRYGIRFYFLNGNRQPTVERDWNFDRDIFKIKLRHVFGAWCIYHQALYKNPGTTL